MTTETNQPDLVSEVESVLAHPDRYSHLYAYRLLRRLVEEVKRLREELDDAYFDRNDCGGRP